MTRDLKISALLLTALSGFALAFHAAPLPQEADYHHFADDRGFLGIANFGNVISGIPFIALGIWGLFECIGLPRREHTVWTVFFTAIFLTGYGSGYYHLHPDNATLVWDRLPMALAFTSLLAALIMERIDEKAGFALFWPLLAAGAGSVFYWQAADDLRPYVLTQFLAIAEAALLLLLFPAQHGKTKYLIFTALCYATAKLLEHGDTPIYQWLDHVVSGHTLKHLVAAAGIWGVIRYIRPLPLPVVAGAETVVLLHGALNSEHSMRSLARAFSAAGYNTINIDYPTRKGRLEQLIDLVHPQVPSTGRVHFIGHSMGGLMIRAYLHKYKPRNLGRVVMIGTPNMGSEVADWLRHNILYKLSFGPAGQQLVTDQSPFAHIFGPVDYELGVIASDRFWDPMTGFFILPRPNDGRVSVERTRLAGMKDFVLTHSEHVFMPHNPDVIRQAVHFIETGRFV